MTHPAAQHNPSTSLSNAEKQAGTVRIFRMCMWKGSPVGLKAKRDLGCWRHKELPDRSLQCPATFNPCEHGGGGGGGGTCACGCIGSGERLSIPLEEDTGAFPTRVGQSHAFLAGLQCALLDWSRRSRLQHTCKALQGSKKGRNTAAAEVQRCSLFLVGLIHQARVL